MPIYRPKFDIIVVTYLQTDGAFLVVIVAAILGCIYQSRSNISTTSAQSIPNASAMLS